MIFAKVIKIIASAIVVAGLAAPFTPALAAAPNLIANASAETATLGAPDGWNQGHWGTNTPTFNYSTNAQDGAHALNLTMSNYTDGDAKWYFAPVNVSAGTSYTFSDYYQSTTPTSVIAQLADNLGNLSYVNVLTLPVSATWSQATAIFTTPAGASSMTVFHVIAANGTLTTDNFTLSANTVVPTPTPTPTPPPIPTPNPGITGVPNPSVENASSGQPIDWTKSKWGTNVSTFTYLNVGHTGTHSLSLTVSGYANGTANWAYAPQPVTAGIGYVFSDWYKSSVPSEVDIAVNMADGSTRFLYVSSAPTSSTWIQERSEFTMPTGSVSASINHLMYQNGTLTTDDFSFLPYQPVGYSRALVTLTFDDGWTTQYSAGLGILNKYGLTGTFYIVSGFLTKQPDYMTVAQIISLKAAGNQIASHTVTHADLTTLTPTMLTNELKNSQTTLTAKFGGPVQDFAAPYGTYNNATVAAASTYYRSYRTTDPGYNGKTDTDLMRLRVQNMTNTTTPAQVQAWVTQAARDKTWLIIVFHQISPSLTAGEYSTTPANLDTELSALKTSGVPVVTMSQAISEITPQLP